MANQKLTDLTALGAGASDEDLLYLVDDPSGTPTEKKVTRANLLLSAITTVQVGLEGMTATDVPLPIELASGQTANAIEVNSNGGSGGNLFRVEADGQVTIATSASFQLEFTGAANANVVHSGTGQLWIQATSKDIVITPVATSQKLINVSYLNGVVINDDGLGFWDFRVEGDTLTHLIFVDASADSVSLGGSSSAKVGFYDSVPITKPTVSGSTGGNAALQDLLTQLASLGLITNSTT